MKPVTQTRRFDYRDRRETNREKPKSMLLMVTLWLGMAVAVLGQDADDRIPPGLSHTQNIDWHEVAQRYGIAEAVHISFQLQEEEVARREMEQVKEAQRRDRELQQKVVGMNKCCFNREIPLNTC